MNECRLDTYFLDCRDVLFITVQYSLLIENMYVFFNYYIKIDDKENFH